MVVAATPIGDPADASDRLRELLRSADVIAAEDTRRLRRLCADLGVSPRGRVVAHQEHNEVAGVTGLLATVRAGQLVLVVTDAGMPTVSDPGYRLVAAAAEAGLPVHVAPGPSAVLAALAVSGLPTDRFCFEGFLPRRAGELARTLAALAGEQRTIVVFEAARRLATSLAVAAVKLGPDRRAVVCRELTKTHQEIRRGTLAELADWASERTLLGEVTLVLAGAEQAPPPDLAALAALVSERVAAGERRKDAARAVAADHGVRARDLYEATTARSPRSP